MAQSTPHSINGENHASQLEEGRDRRRIADAASRQKAAHIAGSVRNVKSVQNLLTVG